MLIGLPSISDSDALSRSQPVQVSAATSVNALQVAGALVNGFPIVSMRGQLNWLTLSSKLSSMCIPKMAALDTYAAKHKLSFQPTFRH